MRAFVTVHDANLIRDVDRRFRGLDVVYLFVGNRPPPDRPNVIHCAAHTPNVEHLYQFYDFTGWYVIADLIRHGVLADTEMLLLQYDMRLAKPASRIERRVHGWLNEQPGPISFEIGRRIDWMPPHRPDFADLYRNAMAIKGIDADRLPTETWPTTQGMAWRADDLAEFMEWFEPLFDVLACHPLAGHLAERTIHAWCKSTGRPSRIATGLVSHESRDSHGTTALFYNDVATYEVKAQTFGR